MVGEGVRIPHVVLAREARSSNMRKGPDVRRVAAGPSAYRGREPNLEYPSYFTLLLYSIAARKPDTGRTAKTTMSMSFMPSEYTIMESS